MTVFPHLDAGIYPPDDSGPFITLKWAQSLDARIAAGSRDSKWITGLEARKAAHQLRAEHDAVLVGVGTILADDPELTVRLVEGRNPARVILDSQLRIPAKAGVLDGAGRTVVATTSAGDPVRRQELLSAGVEVTELDSNAEGHVDLHALMKYLRGLGFRTLLVEGGGNVITSFLRDKLVDQVAIFVAPKLLGSGVEAVGDLGVSEIAHAITFTQGSYEMVGNDMLYRGNPVWPNE